jgi:MYXO-CTERM domain-containing protein
MKNGRSFRTVLLCIVIGTGVYACQDGGLAAGCGLAPIPDGFPASEHIANAGQARVTSTGLDFLEMQLPRLLSDDGTGRILVPIAGRVSTGGFGDADVCPDGGCFLDLQIESATLTLSGTNQIDVGLVVSFFGVNDAGAPAPIAIDHSIADCLATVDTNAMGGANPNIGLRIAYMLADNSPAPRAGYTTLSTNGLVTSDAALPVEGADITLTGGGGLFACETLESFFTAQIEDRLRSDLSRSLRAALDRILCTRADPVNGCPTASTATAEGICVFDSNPTQCVPTLLGADGQGNPTGQLLATLSPGAGGHVQTVLAAGGLAENDLAAGAVSLFFLGGMRSTDASFGGGPTIHHPCVPERPLPTVPIIPRASALQTDVVPGTSTPMDAAFALSESYLNYASYFVFDSGGLCAAAGAPSSPQLHTGVASLLIGSVDALAHPRPEAPIAIALRPQLPPVIELGNADTEPDVLVTLNQAVFDFYVYSLDRYVRALSFRTNVEMPIELEASSGALAPSIGSITLSNYEVTNSDLLPEQPSELADALAAALPLALEPMLSSIPPLELPGVLGFDVSIADGGVQTIEQGGDEFLALFTTFSAPAPIVAQVDTSLALESVDIDPTGLALESFGDGEPTRVRFSAEAEGPLGVSYEYSYRLDRMAWSAWTSSPEFDVTPTVLRLQGAHELEVRARVAGEAASADATPASALILVDVLAPDVWLELREDGYQVLADDIVSRELEARFTLDGETWSEWARTDELPRFDRQPAEVEVRDEAGNVGTISSTLIRGLPDPSAESCGCRAAGSGGGNGWLLALLVGLALVVRRRVLRKGWMALVGLALIGCPGPGGPCEPACPDPTPGSALGSSCCDGACMDYDLSSVCGPGFVCASHEDVTIDASCAVHCGDCRVPPPLDPGMLAIDLSATVSPEGQVLIAGYDPGLFGEHAFGDLVVARWGGDRVEWEIVDGVPDESPLFDPATWRGGIATPGDDVGRHAAAASSDERTYIAYYDATNGALKIAIGGAGAWQVHTIDDTDDSGRFAAIAITTDGMPRVAYRRLSPDPDMPGRFLASIQIAAAASAEPASEDDWTITSAVSGPAPCRPELCASGEACLASGECATPSDDCAAACAAGEVCADAACVASLPAPYVEPLPPGLGLYNQLQIAPDGLLGLVYYDRSQGTLFGARETAAGWEAPFAIAGYAADQDADAGIGASLVIDRQGDWHVSYVDATAETLRYARVRGTEIVYSLVDDGSTDGTARLPDGRHLVGDDSSIVALPTSELRIAYQDATAMQTRIATRATPADPWVVRVIDSTDFNGFYVDQLVGAGRSFVVSAFRGPATDARFGVRVTMP